MFDFEKAEKNIKDGERAIEEINKVIENIIRLKKFQFTLGEIDFDFNFLVNEKVIINDNGTISLLNNNLLFFLAYKQFAKSFSFITSADICSLFNFLKKVDDYFSSFSFIGKSELINGVNKLALFELYKYYEPDLTEIKKTWEKTPGSNLYKFSTAFSNILPFINFPATRLLDLLRSLYISHEYDKPEIFNLSIAELNQAVKDFSKKNLSRAKELLELLMNDFDLLNENISINTLSGIIEGDKTYLSEIKNLATSELYQPSIVVAMSFQKFTDIEIQFVFSILSNIHNNSKKYQLQLPRFYLSIISNYEINDNEITNYCFDKLEKLIIHDDIDIVASVVIELRHLKAHSIQINKLLILMVQSAHFDKKLMNGTRWIFYNYTDCKLFFEFLFGYGVKIKFDFNDELFDPVITHLRRQQPNLFDSELINLLIHDLAEIRFIGGRIFSRLTFFDNKIHPQTNILNLSPKSQFKLFTSILSLFLEPKRNLPFLLPIIFSKNEFVRESIICRIEILTEDYGSNVTEVIKEEWQPFNEEQERIFQRIEQYLINYSNHLKEKFNIKELNPSYTQAQYMNAYFLNYARTFKRNLNENVEKNSVFRQIATTVILAKGGGWKHETKEEVSQLSTISTNMSLPRTYFVSPDNFEFDRKVEELENWKNFLQEWEAIL